MSDLPPSHEFTSLLQRWLDQTASAEEQERLWKYVEESPECAREMAAQVRFESLLGQALSTRVDVRQAEAGLGQAIRMTRQKTEFRQRRTALLKIAALVTLLGSLVWLAWPSGMEGIRLAQQKTLQKKGPGSQMQMVGSASLVERSRREPDKPLPERLDAFFFSRVDFDQVSLRDAVGRLQGQLLELNHLKSEALEKLRVTLPADAAQRKVTFHSGPIAFLKAVRAVAALAGCEVKVDEQSLALILHREIFPQVPEKRSILALLDGLLDAEGRPAAENPQRVAALLEDAASLGIRGDLNAKDVAATRGQWEALRWLTEAREQWRSWAGPGYQLYYVEDDSEKEDRVIPKSEVDQIQRQNLTPVLEIAPGQLTQGVPVPVIPTEGSPPGQMKFVPEGEVVHITIDPPLLAGNNTSVGAIRNDGAFILAPGEGVAFSVNGATLNATGGSSFSLNGALNVGGAKLQDGGGTLVILPRETPP